MVLSEAYQTYQEDVIAFRNQSRRTEEQHNLSLRSLVSACGDIEFEDLTFRVVRDWKSGLEARHISTETIRAYLIKLRVVLRHMRRLGTDCLDPELIQLPKRSRVAPKTITAEEVQRLIDATLKPVNGYPRLSRYRNAAIISLLYSSGIRVSELCSLDRRTVQGDTFVVTGKGNKSRPCFIDERTREYLKLYLGLRTDSSPALFLSRNSANRANPGSIQEILRHARRKAGFDFPVHPHILRHAFATNLLKNGCHIYPLSRLMGHSSIQTTTMYLHVEDPELAEAHSKYHST